MGNPGSEVKFAQGVYDARTHPPLYIGASPAAFGGCYSPRMSGESEAIGDALTGAVIARAIEPTSGESAAETEGAACRNCGAPLRGAYCASCGQPAHLHRSLASLAHDILHGAFHFEGKIWRTLPELLFHPGRLTRRYIDGERAKFVSPMALFLFTVFLIFAVFAFMHSGDVSPAVVPGTPEWRAAQESAITETDEELEQLRAKLADPDTPVEAHADLQAEIEELEMAREAMDALADGNWKRLAEIENKNKQTSSAAQEDSGKAWPAPGSRLYKAIEQVKANPELLSYKIKTRAYKFSWALIPLSVPFLWLLFFWRRDINLYDHAIFTTYSMSFMLLFALLLSLATAFGIPKVIWVTALFVVPPLHLYKQLRGAYSLSRAGALVRLFLLSIFIVIVLCLFFVLLVVSDLWG